MKITNDYPDSVNKIWKQFILPCLETRLVRPICVDVRSGTKLAISALDGGHLYRQRLFKNRENDTDIKLKEPLEFLNYVSNNNTPSYNDTFLQWHLPTMTPSYNDTWARAEDFRRETGHMHKGSHRWFNFKMYILKRNQTPLRDSYLKMNAKKWSVCQ